MRRLAVLVGGVIFLVSLAAAAGPASGEKAPQGRCCFRVLVDVRYEWHLDYKGEPGTGNFKGTASDFGGWSTRFIAAYDDDDLDVGGKLGGALVSSDEYIEANYDVLLLAGPQHVQCTAGTGTHQKDTHTAPFQRVKATDFLARGVKKTAKYGRGIEFGNPKPIIDTPGCPDLLEEPESHGIDTGWLQVTVKAPREGKFKHGNAFTRTCIHDFDGNHDTPFRHHYYGFVIVKVRFVHFHLDELKKNRESLAAQTGSSPVITNDYEGPLTVDRNFCV